MADEPEEPAFDSAATGGTDSAALGLALAGASRAESDAYLKKQGRLADLQIENLHHFEVSHLRWRRFNDRMRGALQIMLVAVGAAIVVAIATMIWNASQAEGFVIDEFSVPPDYIQRGLSGDVIAGDITDRIAAIRQLANDNSLSRSKEVSLNRKNDVRVEIPETGVSVSEAWHYLVDWLGNEKHLSGSLRDGNDGRITLTLTVPGGADISSSGHSADIDALEAKVAEQVFASIEPVNYVNYLSAEGRHVEAMAAAKHFVSIAVGDPMRSDSYGLWTYTTFEATGDFALAIARAKIGISIDPKLAVTHLQLMHAYDDLGRYEEALRQADILLSLEEADQLAAHRSGGFAAMREAAGGRAAGMLGDFATMTVEACTHYCSFPEELEIQAERAARLHDIADARAIFGSAIAAGATDAVLLDEARYYLDMEAHDWRAAVSDMRAVIAAFSNPNGDESPQFLATVAATRYAPLEAKAEAEAGEFAAAHRLIDTTPADCYPCIVARGVIDARQNNPDGAAFWYRHAIAEAPSIPFAYADWGETLLRERKYDAAVAKFKQANAKGPHFADPLEMWGEALMQENRSDLALAKFEAADKYAPNWGRLHLKWGEALYYLGKRDEAGRQFAIAANLDMSPADKAVLARMDAAHE